MSERVSDDAYARRTIAVGGRRLEVYELVSGGRSSEDAIVFLHGMAASWSIWAPVARRLGARARTLCVELPWSSDGGREWAMAPARSLHMIFRSLGLDRFTAVAHSFAATALLAYLDRYGDGLLENIVCVCPFYQDAVEKFDWSTLVYFVDRFHAFLREGLVARQPSYGGGPTVDLMAARVQERIGPEGWLQFFGLFCRTPRLRLSHVERPALVLGGSEDIASRPRYSRELAAAFPRAEVRILEGSGHFPMLQRPAEFTAVVEQFLSRHRRCRQRAGVLGSPGAAGPSHGKEVKSCR